MRFEPPTREPRILSLKELEEYCEFQWWHNLTPAEAHDLAHTAQNALMALQEINAELQVISGFLGKEKDS